MHGDPAAGDMIVFAKPSEPAIDYVKRIAGVPGDTVRMQDDVLYINGKAVPQLRTADQFEPTSSPHPREAETRIETLPNGVRYRVLLTTPHNLSNTQEFSVPAGHYFVLGDNRDNSSDSRAPGGGVGFVPRANIRGKVERVLFSTQHIGRFLLPVELPPMPSQSAN